MDRSRVGERLLEGGASDVSVEPTKKRIMAFHFSPKERTFHIVFKMKDVPGATSEVLKIMKDRVDLIGSQTYSLEDGTAIWSGFVRSMDKNESELKLEKLLRSSPMIKDCEVKGSERGLLVDLFHSGIESGPGRPAVVMPLAGMVHMFDRLVTDFGTGGETILFEEGSALGRSGGEYLNSHLGSGGLDWKATALMSMYRSVGYGSPMLRVLTEGKKYEVTFEDCFECSGAVGKRKECGFFRGQLEATFNSLSGEKFTANETRCRLRGDSLCEFLVSKAE